MDDPEYVLRAKQYQRDYYLKNREKKLQYARDRLAANREQINAARRKEPEDRKLQTRGIVAESKAEYNKRYHIEVRAEEHLRSKFRTLQAVAKCAAPFCANCGEEDYKVLCVNHINGGGRKESRQTPPAEFRKKILSGERSTSDLNVLCFNCNILYEYARGRLRLPRNETEVIAKEIENYGNSLAR